MLYRILSAWLLALSVSALCGADLRSPERLAQDIVEGGPEARVRACQLLPYHGAAALEWLVPLMNSSDPVVAKAAFDTAWYTANALAGPGRDEERAKATTALLPLLASERTWSEKEKGLRLLGVVVPEGTDVTPVAAFLKDDKLGARALFALERIGSQEANQALLSALSDAAPELACGVAEALGHLKRRESVPALAKLAEHADPRVRVAAARALAWTGHPNVIATVRRVREQADEATAFEAADAQLRLADAMAASGGNWDRAMGLYKELLSHSDSRIKGTAIIGLARFGDETMVDPIVDAAKASGMESLLVRAFDYLPGYSASKRIAARCVELNPETRLALLPALGRRGDAAILPAVLAAAESSDPALRKAGLKALGPCNQADALPLLAKAAKTGTPEEADLAQVSARQIAEGMLAKGDVTGAGPAFVALLDLARDEALRRLALQGIAKAPTTEALASVLLTAEKDAALRPDSAQALIAIADVLGKDRGEEALKLLQRVRTEIDPSPAVVLTTAGKIRALGGDPGDSLVALGVVRTWKVVGPFPATEADYEKPFIGEPNVDLTASYPAGNASLAWKDAKVDEQGQVDFLAALGNVEKQFGYAYAEVTVEQETDATVMLGSDDGYRLWLNGVMVNEVKVNRGIVIDSDRIDVHLKAGKNIVLIKLYQNVMGWGFSLRLVDKAGKGLAFTQ